MLVKPEHEKSEVILREVDTELLQVLHQEVLEFLEANGALAVQVNESEGIDRVEVFATFVDEAFFVVFDFSFELTIILQNVCDFYVLLVVDSLCKLLKLANRQISLLIMSLLVFLANCTQLRGPQLCIGYLET